MSERSAEGPAIEVVRPNGEDALIIGDVYLRSWRAGYDGLVDPVRLELVAAERAAYDWPAAINDPDASFALGYVDGGAAGVAKIGPDPTEAVRGTWLELLYVAPGFWGSGVANALLRWATDHAAADGATVMRLRVVEAQHRARRLTSARAGSTTPTSRRRTTSSSRCSACAAA